MRETRTRRETRRDLLKSSIHSSVLGFSVHSLHALQNVQDDGISSGDEKQPSSCPQLICIVWSRCKRMYGTHSFLIKAIFLISIAYAYPPLGATYLAPQITATWIAVIFIFIIAGMGIKTKEFSNAFKQLPFNLFVQVFNFGVTSGLVFGFSRFMISVDALSQSLADGMTICASLPIAINTVYVLTKSAGGDEAAAIFNSAFGNFLGIFLSPALILGYLGVDGKVEIGEVFFKLGVRVVLPVVLGQVLQHFVPAAKEFVKRYKMYFKTAQEWLILFIVYTVFCKTFLKGMKAGAGQILLMIALQFIMLCVVMSLAWVCLRLLFRNEPKLQAVGLFGCTHKTVAMGVPLINAIYESDPNVGLYTLPVLIWLPLQLILGSFVAPYVAEYVNEKEKGLGGSLDGENEEDEDDSNETGSIPDEESFQEQMEQGDIEDV